MTCFVIFRTGIGLMLNASVKIACNWNWWQKNERYLRNIYLIFLSDMKSIINWFLRKNLHNGRCYLDRFLWCFKVEKDKWVYQKEYNKRGVRVEQKKIKMVKFECNFSEIMKSYSISCLFLLVEFYSVSWLFLTF